jgi:hypothetical protein
MLFLFLGIDVDFEFRLVEEEFILADSVDSIGD